MTGYGRAVISEGEVEIVAEVRTVNHRFLDSSVRMPKMYSSYEPMIRKMISESISRGKVELSVSRNGARTAIMGTAVDHGLAQSYYKSLKELRDRFNLAADITVSDMLTLKEIVAPVENEEELEKELELVRAGVSGALEALNEMRAAEGAAMWNDMRQRLEDIRNSTFEIAPMVDQVTLAAKERLEKRIQELAGNMELDRERLAQEVAYMAEKSDVTEELIRIRSHLDQFLALGAQGSPIGRKLDFLLQELHREVNTIASKSSSTDIAGIVVSVKAEVEKIREQTQNIE
jgi:uncharacterized protein (TIGR00255 family)